MALVFPQLFLSPCTSISSSSPPKLHTENVFHRELSGFKSNACYQTSPTSLDRGTAPTKRRKTTTSGDSNFHVRKLCQEGHLHKAMDALLSMDKAQIKVDSTSYTFLLEACINARALSEGKRIHAHMIKTGYKPNVFIENRLIKLYAKCGFIEDALKVFHKMSRRNLASWNTVIRGFAHHGYGQYALGFFREMYCAGLVPDMISLVTILNVCANSAHIEHGKQVHGHVLRAGHELDAFVGNGLVDMYVKCGDVMSARNVFDQMGEQNEVSWTVVISGCAQNGYGKDALQLFCKMQEMGTRPSLFTFPSVLSACASLEALEQGKCVHAQLIKGGFETDVYVGSSIVDMYTKCGVMEDAHRAFDKVAERNVVSWTAMITGCSCNGLGNNALNLFYRMQLEGVKPNFITLISVLRACGSIGAMQDGKKVHAYIFRTGFGSDLCVGNALLDMYVKCGNIDDARRVFEEISNRDDISWNTMLLGYAQTKHVKEGFMLFNQMQLARVKPDPVTLSSVLIACSCISGLKQGKQIHGRIIVSGFESHVSVGNSLIAMYSKCGSIEDARAVFDRMAAHNLASWNSMIAGYADSTCSDEALKLYFEMQLAGMKPDQFTLITVLGSCAKLAAIENGIKVHAHVIKYMMESDLYLGNTLVDMYVKCGKIGDARRVFDNMPDRDVVAWNTMIAGCAQHGYSKEAFQLFEEMIFSGTKPDKMTFVCILSVCNHLGLVDKGYLYFRSMSQDHGIIPSMEHYACMVDLLGRAGRVEEAKDFINRMPSQPNAFVWRTLLSACLVHGNLEIGEHAAKCVLDLEPQDAATYVLLSNIYARAGRWDNAANIRRLMKDRGVKKEPGSSWNEVKNEVHAFASIDG